MEHTDDRSDDDIPENFRSLEPDFIDGTATLPAEMHADWLSVLAAENVRRISEANETDHVFHTPCSVEYIFTACARLRLPPEVKYSALLIFNSFMLQLVNRLHETVYNAKRSDRSKYREWERIEATLSRQTTLRILSAIQIASKLHSYYDSISIKTVKLCLKTLGFSYTEESIMHSELRVLSTIDWKTSHHCTPLVYAESLFKILKTKWVREIDTAMYWHYILLLLDFVFIEWEDVYKKMMANVVGAEVVITREQMCRVQADWFLLACGVIVTAACCAEGLEAADSACCELHRISNVPLADITDMCIAIIDCIYDKGEFLNVKF